MKWAASGVVGGLLFASLMVQICLSAYTLSDHQIIGGGAVQLLNGPWQASASPSLKMQGNVPGDLVTDLYTAGLIADPIRDVNFLNGNLWTKNNWNYSRSFSLTSQDIKSLNTEGDILLVFDGIKMAANIYINNRLIDTSISQFLRLNYSLRALQKQYNQQAVVVGQNQISVVFDTNLNPHGLFAQCSGGWDWAPYTASHSVDGNTQFTKGIWKDVYLVWVPWVAVTDTVLHTFYTGPYPTVPLEAGKHSPFQISVVVYTYNYAQNDIGGTVLEVRPSWVPDNQQPAYKAAVSVPAGSGMVSAVFTVTASQIRLWWPVGLGDQPLYDVKIVLTNPSANITIADSRRIGFRFAVLVTGNDTDPLYVQKNKDTDGTDSFGLMWRINGQAFSSRGANVIPMDNLEGRFTANAHRQMVLSARDGAMNTLRIWGGGIYLPQVFYDTCDEIGVLVHHDLMNRASWQGLAQEESAYRHQIRRLSHHPSITVWNGCNECGGANNVVPKTVSVAASEDTSRVIWPSCPSPGWKTGVNRLTSMPNGNPFSLAPSNGIEAHGPYNHGTGWPAMNGNTNMSLFPADLPSPNYPSAPINLGQPNQFTSEFGSAIWSSFESVTATLSPQYWALHGIGAPDKCTGGGFPNTCNGTNVLAQRNYPCDSIIAVYFGKQALVDLDIVGEHSFKKQLFECVIGSSLKIKAYIEETRSRNCFGTLIWQLNEIWPTGGWGLLEYGSEGVAGQVIGGRWKPIQYWLKNSLFTDIFIVCGVQGTLGSSLWCYVKNDSPAPIPTSVLNIRAFALANATDYTVLYRNATFDLHPGPDSQRWIAVTIPAGVKPTTHAIIADLTNSRTNAVLSRNYQLLAAPYLLTGYSHNNISVTVADKPNQDQSVNITLAQQQTTSSSASLFVTLTTAANGRFSDNAFFMLEKRVTVQFLPFGDLNFPLLRSSLRIEHLGTYL